MALKSNGKASLSRHPLFPALVALWFAALLGMGSLAIRATVLENAVLTLGIDRLVPAAAPPLGFTARLLLALGLGLTGALAGFVLARRLTAAPAPANTEVRSAPAASVDTEAQAAGSDDNDDLARLEAARVDAGRPESGKSGRRRALTTESSLGTEAPAILHLGELDDLDHQDAIPTAPQAAPIGADRDAAPEAPAPIRAEAPAAPPQKAAFAGNEAARRLRETPLENLGVAELVERFALALAARRAAQSEPAADIPAPAPAPAIATPDPEPFPPAIAVTSPLFAAEEGLVPDESAETRPFDMPAALRHGGGLGDIEWFGDEDDAESDAHAEATLESLLPPKRPAAADPLRTLASGEGFDADEALDWALPEPDDEVDEAALLDDGAEDDAAEAPFSSLLDMKPSPRVPAPPAAPFVRVEDAPAGDLPEPVVTFPGQAVPPPPIPARLPGAPFGATPVQTEAALRDALAALQKMSGAA